MTRSDRLTGKGSAGVRVVSGSLRGRVIRTPEGRGTRPLLTRLRKTLADVLRPRLGGVRVLDLFGGSGAIGFELLSNGASSVTFVELDEAAARLIRANAQDLGVGHRVAVVTGDALRVLTDLAARKQSFDVVVVAPPYGMGLQAAALEAVEHSGVLNPAGVVVVQREEKEPPTPGSERLPLVRVRRYGRTVFEFFEPRPEAGRPEDIA